MVNYALGKIYKIVCNNTGLIYIGSTCEPTLARRLAGHVGNYKQYKKGKCKYITSFKVIEGDNYDIILIEEIPCESKDQLHKRERYFIESNECVNRNIPTRTQKEYDKEFRPKILERHREYNINNKDKLKAYFDTHKNEKHEYDKKRRLIKGKVVCCCGSIYGGAHKSDHEKTKKHQEYIKFQEEGV